MRSNCHGEPTNRLRGVQMADKSRDKPAETPSQEKVHDNSIIRERRSPLDYGDEFVKGSVIRDTLPPPPPPKQK